MLATCHYILAHKVKAANILKSHAGTLFKILFPHDSRVFVDIS